MTIAVATVSQLLVRFGQISSLWIDEVYSLQVTLFDPLTIPLLALQDGHPPGYYYLLKGWNQLAEMVGLAPNLFWSRSLNLVPWLVLCFASSRLVLLFRASDERSTAVARLLLASLVGMSPAALILAQDLRGYAFAAASLMVVFVCSFELFYAPRALSSPRSTLLVAAILSAALFAVFVHLASAIALLAIGASLSFPDRPSDAAGRRLAWIALISGLGVVLVGLASVRSWLPAPGDTDSSWMTPASVKNLLFTVFFWMPMGRLGDDPLLAPNAPWLWLGTTLVLLLAVHTLLSHPRLSRDTDHVSNREWLVAIRLIGASLLFVLMLWVAARFELAPLFHGPRYPLLLAPAFFAGQLLLLCSRATSRQHRSWLVALTLVCYSGGSLAASLELLRRQSKGGLTNWLQQESLDAELRASLDAQAPTKALIAAPFELLPYFDLGEHYGRPTAPLAFLCSSPEAQQGALLELSTWPALLRPGEFLFVNALTTRQLARNTRTREFPPGLRYYKLTAFADIDTATRQKLCASALTSPFEAQAVAVGPRISAIALPEEQVVARWWSFLEVLGLDRTARWSTAETATIRFRGRLEAGEYTVKLHGYREPFPNQSQTMALRLPDSRYERATVSPGFFDLQYDFRLSSSIRHPTVAVQHPLWSPAASGSRDSRSLGFLFLGATIERSGT